MGVEGDGGAPLRHREGGQRKQLGRARWRWGRKERRTSILFKLPGEANTNKQRWAANGRGERERKERKGEEVEKSRARSRTGRKTDVSLYYSRPSCPENRSIVHGVTTPSAQPGGV